MKTFLTKVEQLRPDLSNWLVHFAKGSEASAKASLGSILKNGLQNRGKGLCFTESPIREFSTLFEGIFLKHAAPMYAPFGIAVRKEWFFARGGRPVIYLPESERKHLGEPIQFLFEEYEPGVSDFTWLREWRSNASSLKFEREDVVAIVPSEHHAEGMLFEWDVDAEYEGPDEYSLTRYRDYEWWYLTLDEIRKAKKDETCDQIILKLLTDKGRDDD